MVAAVASGTGIIRAGRGTRADEAGEAHLQAKGGGVVIPQLPRKGVEDDLVVREEEQVRRAAATLPGRLEQRVHVAADALHLPRGTAGWGEREVAGGEGRSWEVAGGDGRRREVRHTLARPVALYISLTTGL